MTDLEGLSLYVMFFLLGTFRSEDEDDYEYEFSVLSTRTSKNVGLQTLCACSVRKTRTGTRSRPPIQRSLLILDYEYEIEYEYDFSILVQSSHYHNTYPCHPFNYSLPSTNMKNEDSGNVTGLKFENCTRTQFPTRSQI